MSSSILADLFICTAVGVLTLSACSQQRPQTTSTNPQPTRQPATSIEAESWTPRIISGSYTYLVNDSSIVSINNDTASRVLPIKTTMSYSIAIGTLGDSFSIFGKVDSSRVSSQIQTRAQIHDSMKIAEIHGILTSHGEIELSSPEQFMSCSSSSNSTATRVYELIVPYPKKQLNTGARWSDTVSTTNCHGKTPLTQQMIRQFQVKGFTIRHDREAVEIQRLTNTIFSGTSSESNTHLQASGSGSGDATLFLDRTTAVLLESDSQTKSSLTIVTSRGAFPFTQLTSTHITMQQAALNDSIH